MRLYSSLELPQFLGMTSGLVGDTLWGSRDIAYGLVSQFLLPVLLMRETYNLYQSRFASVNAGAGGLSLGHYGEG